jgi:hypothetical protein
MLRPIRPSQPPTQSKPASSVLTTLISGSVL